MSEYLYRVSLYSIYCFRNFQFSCTGKIGKSEIPKFRCFQGPGKIGKSEIPKFRFFQGPGKIGKSEIPNFRIFQGPGKIGNSEFPIFPGSWKIRKFQTPPPNEKSLQKIRRISKKKIKKTLENPIFFSFLGNFFNEFSAEIFTPFCK